MRERINGDECVRAIFVFSNATDELAAEIDLVSWDLAAFDFERYSYFLTCYRIDPR